MAPEKDYTHRSWIAVTLLIAVLIGLSLIPPQTLGGVSLRRANILSDLISFEEDLEKAEKAIDLDDADFHIDLTQVEFQIMELFFRNPGTALVREKILEGVWGKNYFGDVKIVDVNIRRLRMKIEDEPSSPQHILTVWGYGYRWNA